MLPDKIVAAVTKEFFASLATIANHAFLIQNQCGRLISSAKVSI